MESHVVQVVSYYLIGVISYYESVLVRMTTQGCAMLKLGKIPNECSLFEIKHKEHLGVDERNEESLRWFM